jgi:hypothetical protein
MLDAGIPMSAASASMPMPTYGKISSTIGKISSTLCKISSTTTRSHPPIMREVFRGTQKEDDRSIQSIQSSLGAAHLLQIYEQSLRNLANK